MRLPFYKLSVMENKSFNLDAARSIAGLSYFSLEALISYGWVVAEGQRYRLHDVAFNVARVLCPETIVAPIEMPLILATKSVALLSQ